MTMRIKIDGDYNDGVYEIVSISYRERESRYGDSNYDVICVTESGAEVIFSIFPNTYERLKEVLFKYGKCSIYAIDEFGSDFVIDEDEVK